MKGKRGKIRIFSFVLALVLVLGTVATTESYKRREYERLISISQQRALSELARYMDDIELSLRKGMYANTGPMISSLAATLWRDAAGAKTSLSQLDTSETSLENTYKFLSQVGEFTMALNRKIASGDKITDEEKEQLKQLLGYATELCGKLDYLQMMLENNNLSFERILSTLSIDSGDPGDSPENFLDSFYDTEQALTDYPILLYDGPFADNIDKKESKLLKSLDFVTVDEAKELAARYSGISVSELRNTGEEDGKMPSYVFEAQDYTISVTKSGGLLSYMLCPLYSGEASLDQQQAVQEAKKYLDKIGYKDMGESYYSTTDDICTINFAYTKDDIVFYPDLIKVGVSLDDARIVSVDARGYIMNHYDRKPDTPLFGIELGKSAISPDLSVIGAKYTLIPKANGGERYAYEYHCVDGDSQEVLVYIDTKSGDEAEILLLLYEDGGVLTR